MAIINVQMQAYAKASYPDRLYTSSAGVCSIIAIYDPLRKVAFMGHFADFSGSYQGTPKEYNISNRAYYEEMLGAAGKSLNFGSSKAIVSGLMLHSMNGTVPFRNKAGMKRLNRWTLRTRERLVRELVASGIPETGIQVLFHEQPNRESDVELDLERMTATLDYTDFTGWSRARETRTVPL